MKKEKRRTGGWALMLALSMVLSLFTGISAKAEDTEPEQMTGLVVAEVDWDNPDEQGHANYAPSDDWFKKDDNPVVKDEYWCSLGVVGDNDAITPVKDIKKLTLKDSKNAEVNDAIRNQDNDGNELPEGVYIICFSAVGEYTLTYDDNESGVTLTVGYPLAALYEEANISVDGLCDSEISYGPGDKYFIKFSGVADYITGIDVHFNEELGLTDFNWERSETSNKPEDITITIPDGLVSDLWEGISIHIYGEDDFYQERIYNLVPKKTGLVITWTDGGGAPVPLEQETEDHEYGKGFGAEVKNLHWISLAVMDDEGKIELIPAADIAKLSIIGEDGEVIELEGNEEAEITAYNTGVAGVFGIRLENRGSYKICYTEGGKKSYVNYDVDFADAALYALPYIDDETVIGGSQLLDAEKNVYYVLGNSIKDDGFEMSVAINDVTIEKTDDADDADDADYADDADDADYADDVEIIKYNDSVWKIVVKNVREGDDEYDIPMTIDLTATRTWHNDNGDVVEIEPDPDDPNAEPYTIRIWLHYDPQFTEGITYSEDVEAAIKNIADLEEALDSLPEASAVKTSDESTIKSARAFFDSLDERIVDAIFEGADEKISDAEQALADAVTAEKNATAAKEVTDKIKALPAADSVTVADKDKIEAARAAYNALTSDQKKLVDAATLKILTDAEAAYNAAKAAASQGTTPAAPEPTTPEAPAPAAPEAPASPAPATPEAPAPAAPAPAAPAPAEVGATVTDTAASGSTATYTVTDKSTGAGDTGEVAYAGEASDSKATSVVIPDTITGADGVVYEVTKIADNALKNNKTVKSVTVGNNIVEIGSGAFQNAKSLTKIDLGSNVTTIGKNALKGAKKLKDIKVNGNKLKKVGKGAFNGIKKNAKITIKAKDKKTYNKVVKMIKKSGAKKVKYKFKKKK